MKNPNREESITAKIESFSKFLSACWPHIAKTMKGSFPEDVKDDWLQANWEILVERDLPPNVWLEIYGSGADCYGDSSRVSYKDKIATHAFYANPKKGIRLETSSTTK